MQSEDFEQNKPSFGPDGTVSSGNFSSPPQTIKTLNSQLLGSVLGGRYELLKLLGEGGMSAVFLSRHKDLDQFVAVKVLRYDKLLSQDDFKRFSQEAKATFQLNHPNLIRLIDFSASEEELPFLVMEYVAGQTLSELMQDKEKLDAEEFIAIFSQVCDGLAYAHSKGIIHRDLKPSNIMLNKEIKGAEIVKIVDFGIAKISSLDKEQQVTKTGDIFGSPFYMSPEQCKGLALDQRSDLYSLGCVMFQCLSGYVPYCGDNSMQTLFMHVERPVPTFSDNDADTTPAQIQLQQIISQLLQKDKEQRFQTAEDVKKALLEPPDLYHQKVMNRLAPPLVAEIDTMTGNISKQSEAKLLSSNATLPMRTVFIASVWLLLAFATAFFLIPPPKTASEMSPLEQHDDLRAAFAKIMEAKKANDKVKEEALCVNAINSKTLTSADRQNISYRGILVAYLFLISSKPENERNYAAMSKTAQSIESLMSLKPRMLALNEGQTFGFHGHAMMGLNDYLKALALYDKAAAISAQAGSQGDERWSNWTVCKAHALVKLDRTAEAIKMLEDGVSAANHKLPLALFNMLRGNAQVLWTADKHQAAWALANQAQSVLKKNKFAPNSREVVAFNEMMERFQREKYAKENSH